MNAAIDQVTASADVPSGPSEWGTMALAAQATGEMKPVWTAFLKRKFYVPILRSPDDNPQNYLLHFERDANGRHPTLVITERRERMDLEQGDGLVALSGVELLSRLDGQGAIRVLLRDGVFNISKKRGAWLASGVEVTKARVVVRKMLSAAAPGGPFPVLRVRETALAEPAPAPGLMGRVNGWIDDVRDARYFVPVVLSVSAIGMLWVLGLAGQGSTEAAHEPQQVTARKVIVGEAGPSGPAVKGLVLHAFSPWDNSFTVNLPGMAEEMELSPDQVAQMDGLASNYYRLQLPGVLYEASVIHFGARVPTNTSDELDHRQQLLIGSDGALVSAQTISIGGVPAREAKVRLRDGTERMARFAFNGDKLCMVMVTTAAGAAPPVPANTVMHSFQLPR